MVVSSSVEREVVCYPYVVDRRRRLVRASDVGAVVSGYFCLGCGDPVERVGPVAVGHGAEDGGGCLQDRALAHAARLAVRDGYLEALESGGEYVVASGCRGCGEFASRVGLVGGGAEFRFGERGEVVFTIDGGALVVDFVVAGQQGQSEMLVEESAVPVYRVELNDFRCVDELRLGVTAAGGLCIEALCQGCAAGRRRVADEREELRGRERDERVRWLAERDEEIRAAARSRVRGLVRETAEGVSFGPWYRSRGGEALVPVVQKVVFANAVILTECGFRQHNPEKPWLFRYVLGGGVNAYADLGGAGVSVDGREPKVGLYLMGTEREEAELRDLIRGEIERRLRDAGVDVSGGDGPSEAVWRVDRATLDSLVEVGALPDMGGVRSVDSIGRWRGSRMNVPAGAGQ